MKLLTPPGLSGIAVLEVEQAERDPVLAALQLPSGSACSLVAGGAPVRAELRLAGKVVDDVLALRRVDDQIELHVHGSPAVLDQLHRQFGVSVAGPETPAERLLREALSPQQFDLAAEQLVFDWSAELDAMRALPEPARSQAARQAVQRSRVARALVSPARVALVGRKNAGKSTLFNQLLFRERALTGATPGLTRDAIAEVTTLVGYPYELVDTAGVGKATDDLDAMAIDSSLAAREHALLVLVVDGSSAWTDEDQQLFELGALVVRSKCELVMADWPAHVDVQLSLSSRRDGPESTRFLVGERLREHRSLPSSAGAVGGVAALDDAQWQQLLSVADCLGDPSPA